MHEGGSKLLLRLDVAVYGEAYVCPAEDFDQLLMIKYLLFTDKNIEENILLIYQVRWW